MQIVNEKPPIWEEILDTFNIDVSRTVFTFGDTIYNPAGRELPDHLICHESVHGEQQDHTEIGAIEWWNRYFADQWFRVDQEARAYGAQYTFVCKKVKDRNQRARALVQFATSLSGPMYGNVINHQSAVNFIKKHANV